MNDEQRLYPHKIYQKNRLLEEFKQMCGVDDKIISFNIIDFYSRRFNWYVVNKERWMFKEQIINNINECISVHSDEWRSFFEERRKQDFKELKDSIEYFGKERKTTNWSDKKNRREFHFHLLNLYQYYPHKAQIGIDGVIYRNFIDQGERLCYAKGELLTDTDKYGKYYIYPWINMTFVYKSGKNVNSLSAQENLLSNKESKNDIEYTTETDKNEKIKEMQDIETIALSQDKVYFNYLVPLVMGYPDPIVDKDIFNGSWKCNQETKYFLDDDTIKTLLIKLKYIICFPVYDAFVGSRLYGNFYGNVTIFFEKEDERVGFIEDKDKISRIEESLFLLIR